MEVKRGLPQAVGVFFLFFLLLLGGTKGGGGGSVWRKVGREVCGGRQGANTRRMKRGRSGISLAIQGGVVAG